MTRRGQRNRTKAKSTEAPKPAQAPKEQPKKQRRAPKQKKQNFGDKLIQAEGGQGTNPLSAAAQVTSPNGDALTVPGVDPTLDIIVKVTDRSLYYLSMGICLRAIKRGWSTQQNFSDGSVYYSFRYLYDTFVAATQGTVPLLQQAPWWFWELIHAMRPKTEKFKTGKVGYTTEVIETGQSTSDIFSLSNSEQFAVVWGVPYSGTFVNGYPILAPPQQPYTPELGAQSVQSLFTFYNSIGMSKRTGDPGDKAWMTHDTSFFSTVYADIGQSFFCPGGASIQVYSERQLTAPIFAKFATWEGEGDETAVWRGNYHYRRSGGSPTYIGPRLSELTSPKELYNKGEVMFMIYNFDKFVERLALTLALALEQEAARPNLSGTGVDPCPLTFQDFKVLVRQSIIPFFCNDMAQDIRMSSDSGVKRTVTMLPLVVGPNGVSFTAQSEGPLFPKFFTESVRACNRLVFMARGNYNNQAGGKLIDFVPVLCRPVDYQLPLNYTFQDNGQPRRVFADPPQAEVPINLIDCSVQVGQDTYYLDLNGQTMQSNIAEWNSWIKKRIALTGLSTLGSEMGISALNANIYTSHDRTFGEFLATNRATTATTIAKRNSMKRAPKVIGSAPKRYGSANVDPEGPDYLKDVSVTSVSSQIPFTAAIWKYAQHLTLPSFFVSGNVGSGSYSLYATNYIQPYNLPLAGAIPDDTNTIGPGALVTVYNHNLASAALDIRPPLNDGKSEMEVDMDTLAAQGRGGLFTDIAAALSDTFGAKGLAGVIRNVGQITGW